MGAEQSYFIVPVTSGLCLEPNRSKYSLLYTKVPDAKNQNQHWVLERHGNKVAFRNVAGKDYLYALGNKNQSQVRLQSSPHWWSLEPGRTAGSFWIKSEDVGGYLCNPYGHHSENNQQWMWSYKEAGYTQRLLFYLQDTRSLNGSPDLVLSSGAAAAASPEQAQAKEKEHKEKEDQFAAREKEIATKEEDLIAKQKEFETKQREFEASQKAAAERQTNLEEREKKVAAKEASSGKGGKGNKDTQTQVEQLQSQLAEANKALEDARQREESSTAAAKEQSAKGEETEKAKKKELLAIADERDAEMTRLQDEIDQLQARVRELESSSSDESGNSGSPRRPGGRIGDDSDPSSDDRWRSNASFAAGARRTRPSGMRTDYDYESDPRWKPGAPGAAGTLRKDVPGLKTGGDYKNDPRWTSKAPAAAKTKRPDPEGMKTRESRPVREGELPPIVMPREFSTLPRLRAAS